MLELEELKNKYIKYSEEITEDTFNKILYRAKEFAKEICPDLKTYRSFDDHSFDSFRLNKFFRFSGSSCSYGVDNNRQDAEEIKVSDILGEETKFEVGKWYSFYWNWSSGNCVGKVCQVNTYEKTVIQFDNYTSNNSPGKLFTDGRTIDLAEIENIKELSLEEIQQYLPEGHSDKIVKTIEKWSVGSYVVFCRNNTCKKVLLNKPYKIEKTIIKDHIKIIDESGDFDSTNYTSRFYDIKWFATLSEAETFSKELLEPKPLTIDDLVKGEIYKTQINNKTYLIRATNKLGGYDLCLIISSESPELIRKARSISWDKIELPTSEEAKWFIVCEKQDKFIPKEDLSKYDVEGNLIEQRFKVVDWVIVNDFILAEYSKLDYLNRAVQIIKSTPYTSEGFYNVNIPHNREGGLNVPFASTRLATQEEIALVVKPKSKEFDRNWYVKVNSQEEANKVFGWLESQGEKIEGRIIDTTEDQYIRMDLYEDVWRISGNTGGKLQKQLSDILPNYSKVNRNVYYEVENQEQYLEILDWLESKGEFLHPNSRKLEVTNNCKYVVFNLSIPNSWVLRGGIPNLPKAEFQFKGKSKKQPIKTGMGLREQILDCSGYILSDLSIPDFFSTQNSIIELNQESTKLLSFDEDDVVLFKTNSVKISNEQLIIND